MKVLFKYCFFALAGLVGLSLASCEDDDKDGGNSAKAVLSSVSSLSFDATNAPGMTIEVVSDKKWTVDAPDWVIVDPTSGSGAMDVTISVKDNVEGGVIQLPRRENICFHGATAASRCEILIIQDGDPFLGSAPLTGAELAAAKDGDGVVVKNLTVTDHVSDGFMATDGVSNVKVLSTEKPAVGNTVTVYGYKNTDKGSMAVVEYDHADEGGTAAALPEAVEITDKLDTYSSDTRTLVKISGLYDASGAIVVEGMAKKANVTGQADGLNMKELGGHKVTVEAYYGGAVNSGMNIIVRKAEDHGVDEVVYYFDDFEWLEPWASIKPAGDTVGENNSDATAQQLGTNKVGGVATYDALLDKGYDFVTSCSKDKSPREAKAQAYLQRCYLKMGLTGYYTGIVLPAFDVPEKTKTTISFSWSVQRQGSGKYDATELVVIVSDNGKDTQFPVPPHDLQENEAYRWIQASVDLGDILTSTSRITIRNCDAQWPDPADKGAAFRYHIDNIKIAQTK